MNLVVGLGELDFARRSSPNGGIAPIVVPGEHIPVARKPARKGCLLGSSESRCASCAVWRITASPSVMLPSSVSSTVSALCTTMRKRLAATLLRLA
ncbi:hypothetical protein ABID58_007551 [Bradyrhizobium sp. S3.2.6]